MKATWLMTLLSYAATVLAFGGSACKERCLVRLFRAQNWLIEAYNMFLQMAIKLFWKESSDTEEIMHSHNLYGVIV